MKQLLLFLFISAPIFAALPEGAKEFLANASKVSPMAYAPDPEAAVAYSAKFGQFSFRSDKKSYTVTIYEVYSPTAVCAKEVQRENVSYYLMVVDPIERKIFRGTPKNSPNYVDAFEDLTEDNLFFYRK